MSLKWPRRSPELMKISSRPFGHDFRPYIYVCVSTQTCSNFSGSLLFLLFSFLPLSVPFFARNSACTVGAIGTKFFMELCPVAESIAITLWSDLGTSGVCGAVLDPKI